MLDRLIPNNIELRTLRAPSLGLVRADAGQIEQIVLNLVVNARDAMPQGGCLILETKNVDADEAYIRMHETVPLGKYVMLNVSDNGTGMDRATQDRMFDPFFTTKEPGKGTGLGLATVYGVLQQMGGAIWVRSEPGNGPSFEIYLPRVEVTVTSEIPASEPLITPLANAPAGTETILLVEDQDGIRDMVLDFLQRKGYTVLQAMNGQEALSIAAAYEFPIDLLITDVVMPKIGGRELVRLLSQSRPHMKVLFMSGFPEHVTLSGEVVDENAAVLQKPFLLDSLARKVRSVLEDSDHRE
jgi:CheY-like chemotaxis protein